MRSYLVGLLLLVALAGCGRWFAEREPWRREAEIACLKSGAVKEGPTIVQAAAISGPGVCGADFPLRVTALGEAPALGFADTMRPPGDIPSLLARMPPSRREPPQASYSPSGGPMPLRPPGLSADDDPVRTAPTGFGAPGLRPRYPGSVRAPTAPAQPAGPAEITPPATLACPIVSKLDAWLAADVQPAALRWLGQPVVSIKQISAYSCRGMNGQPGARISEHAFGNALDIAAFTLADGRTITVRDGWHGVPEEQGFLRDVHASACAHFSTVLAPGSNAFHYDHLHVDLMRRDSGRTICNPDPVPGDVIAARASARRVSSYPPGRRMDVTGSASRRGRNAVAGED